MHSARRGRYRFVSYRHAVVAGHAMLASYFALAVLSPLHLIQAQEVFPFFSWSLFSSPKKQATYYSLLLEASPGSATLQPQFVTADGYVRLIDSPLNRHVSLTKVLATYSREARLAPDPARTFDGYRAKVDAIVAKEARRYHLFETVYDPIQLFRERRYGKTTYIGTYDVPKAVRHAPH
jgi:hypothetical protein